MRGCAGTQSPAGSSTASRALSSPCHFFHNTYWSLTLYTRVTGLLGHCRSPAQWKANFMRTLVVLSMRSQLVQQGRAQM